MKRVTSLTLSLFLALALAVGCLPAALAEAELPTLKVLGPYVNFDPNADPTAAAIEERTGYHVEYSMLPAENADENLLLQIASGETYDILRISPTQYRQLLEMGALMPLDDLLEAYGPNLTSLITEEAYELVQSDGQTYGIPMMAEREVISAAVQYRKDILDELGLEAPTTPEEFRDVLAAVKEAYPDMIPLCLAGGVWVPTLVSGFGFYTNWVERDGEIVNYQQLPEYQEYLKYMKSLYDEGLLDADLPINTTVTVDEKFSSGRAFAVSSGWYEASTQVPALMENLPDAEVAYLDPLYDANGNAGVATAYALNNVTCIPKNAPHAEDAVKFMNAKLEYDTFTYITLGTEGETFTIDEDGNYYPIMPIFTELRNNAYWYLNSFDMTRYGDMWMARTRRNEALGEAFDAINANFDQFAVRNPVDFAPVLPSVAENSTALSQMEADYQIQAMVGVESLDDFDTYLQSWLDAGGQACLDDYNGWYTTTQAE